jgi:BASS family bile acid:Na+ symporter
MGIIIDVILPLALAFIMFALGLGLTGNDFLRVLKQPKDFLVGLISQIILLPIIAFILVKIWPISSEIAIGVMIIAAAPGGVTSNILTSFAKGDVALSISLTAIISLLSVITVPFVIITSLNLLNLDNIVQDVSLTSMALSMFLIVTAPVIFGMSIRKFASNAAISFETTAKKISIFLFILVLIGAILAERNNVISYFAQAGLITLLLNVIMMFLAFYVAQFLGSGSAQKKCIAIECGLQNGTLAIFVATSLFGGGAYLVPAATYSLIKGTRIIDYVGKIITKKETEKAEKFDNLKPIYLFNLNDRYDLDGDVPWNTARLINHSCLNNCDYEGKGLKLWVTAIKDIKKAEEITCDYGFSYDENYKQFPCKCSSRNCVGYIVREGSRWRIDKKFKKTQSVNR